jgi:GNAT superfamily N-acetyltransferase
MPGMDDSETTPTAPFHIRDATPADIPSLMRLKLSLAQGEDSTHAVRASAADWLRDGFGEHAGFCAFVAEPDGAVVGNSIVGMATCSRRTITGWDGPVIFLQDLFVEPGHRRRGIAGALIACVAAYARELGSPIVELTVRADNPAQVFYRQNGFAHLPNCLTYVLAGSSLAALAARGKKDADSKQALALAG